MDRTQSKIFLTLILIINLMSCKAQTLPLNTSFLGIPNGAYVKDTNNELAPYVGVYKANFNGNEITLFITKQENKIEKSARKTYYMDALIVKYTVKNSSGNILQDTQNNNLSIAAFYSIDIDPTENKIGFVYTGTNCRVGWGTINLKKINTTQISWEYRPEDRIIMPGKCPGNPDTTIYLPETKGLIFNKQ